MAQINKSREMANIEHETDEVLDDVKSKKVGRPRIEFNDRDWKMVEQMCGLHCTGQEIAGFMDVSYETLVTRIREEYSLNFPEYFRMHVAKGLVSLRRKQRDVAMDGNVQMLIHLGKNYLGQTDKQQVDNTSSDGSMGPVFNIVGVSPDDTSASGDSTE